MSTPQKQSNPSKPEALKPAIAGLGVLSLAACGGGNPGATPPTSSESESEPELPWVPSGPPTLAEASAFLAQAGFGGTRQHIDEVVNLGFDGWIAKRFGSAFSQAMKAVLRKPSLHLMEEEYADTLRVAIDTALVAMNIADRVTTFTASDFGRTLTSNGDGTDHGWGSHHFLMGGALNGNCFLGQMPPMGLRHNWDLGRGRLLPTTSVTQLSAELARWFGVSDSDFPTVFPNGGTFDLHQLGIFKANA